VSGGGLPSTGSGEDGKLTQRGGAVLPGLDFATRRIPSSPPPRSALLLTAFFLPMEKGSLDVNDLLALGLLGVSLVASLTMIGCYILVLIQIFQHGETTRGIIYTLGLFLCGIGVLLTFLYGYRKQKEWGIETTMNIFGIAFATNIICRVAAAVLLKS
jgi:hypothetical protein